MSAQCQRDFDFGTATIFSHIMLTSVDDVQRIGRQGIA
jgi:hypothetical protein